MYPYCTKYKLVPVYADVKTTTMVPKLSMIIMHCMIVFLSVILLLVRTLWCLSLVKLPCVDSALILFFN